MTSNFVWIRHASKQYCNGKGPDGSHQHDSPIKEDTDDQIFDKTEMLVRQFGFPDQILFSPFLRTRQTKDKMLVKLQEIDPFKASDIQIIPDESICEYLGFQKPFGRLADLEEETHSYFVKPFLLGETFKSLNQRVKQHIQKLNYKSSDSPRNVWIITHGIILNNIHYTLSRSLGSTKEFHKYPPPLCHITLQCVYSENKYSLCCDEI